MHKTFGNHFSQNINNFPCNIDNTKWLQLLRYKMTIFDKLIQPLHNKKPHLPKVEASYSLSPSFFRKDSEWCQN